jgi:hypothetical protein
LAENHPRVIKVRQTMEQYQETLKKGDRLSSCRILPLSGAQLIHGDEVLSKEGAVNANARERPRIEIQMGRFETQWHAALRGEKLSDDDLQRLRV